MNEINNISNDPLNRKWPVNKVANLLTIPLIIGSITLLFFSIRGTTGGLFVIFVPVAILLAVNLFFTDSYRKIASIATLGIILLICGYIVFIANPMREKQFETQFVHAQQKAETQLHQAK